MLRGGRAEEPPEWRRKSGPRPGASCRPRVLVSRGVIAEGRGHVGEAGLRRPVLKGRTSDAGGACVSSGSVSNAEAHE